MVAGWAITMGMVIRSSVGRLEGDYRRERKKPRKKGISDFLSDVHSWRTLDHHDFP
jgi:hypothetical protein